MLRIGAVSYLNTRPLISGLRERLRGLGELKFNLPSRLADDLAVGKLDVALIPSLEFFRGIDSGYRVISDAAIACRGPVWSVRLLSRVPIGKIKRLALDEGSRTSAAMVQVLLAEQFGVRPELRSLPMEQDPESIDADAILLIGDRAMQPAPGNYEVIWDLGERWVQWTGLPFVFAMWVTRADFSAVGEIREADLKHALEASRDEGRSQLLQIAEREAGTHGLTIPELHQYFTDNLHFQLGPRELDGLEMYRQAVVKHSLLRLPEPKLRSV